MIIDPRLIRAEALKLYKRHGMIALSVALTAGLAVLAFGIGAVQHAADPARYRPAGGLRHYREALSFLDLMLLVVGAVVGSTAGAADLESGVFRDLAATGRSRFALYAARTPGAWAIVLPLAVLVSAIAGAAALVFAGSSTNSPLASQSQEITSAAARAVRSICWVLQIRLRIRLAARRICTGRSCSRVP